MHEKVVLLGNGAYDERLHWGKTKPAEPKFPEIPEIKVNYFTYASRNCFSSLRSLLNMFEFEDGGNAPKLYLDPATGQPRQ